MPSFINPYNFVRFAGTTPALREKPVGHSGSHPGLHSGRFVCRLVALSPIFIPYRPPDENRSIPGVYELIRLPPSPPKRGETQPRSRPPHKSFLKFFHTGDGIPTIPATSLKGELRSIAEALSNGCVSLFGGEYEEGHRVVADLSLPVVTKGKEKLKFTACDDFQNLCPTCRLFGMSTPATVKEEKEDEPFFRGKVTFNDARLEGEPQYLNPVLLIELSNPKPRHRQYYSEGGLGQLAVGRKFYYHSPALGLLTARPEEVQLLEKFRVSRNLPAMSPDGLHRKNTIRPLTPFSIFRFEIDFHDLTDAELALLVYSLELSPMLTLEEGHLPIDSTHRLKNGAQMIAALQAGTGNAGVYHKIGYGKPAGLGTSAIYIEELINLNPQDRYSGVEEQTQPASGQRLREWVANQKQAFLEQQAVVQPQADGTMKKVIPQNIRELRQILRWPNRFGNRLRYPSRDENEFTQPLALPGHEGQ